MEVSEAEWDQTAIGGTFRLAKLDESDRSEISSQRYGYFARRYTCNNVYSQIGRAGSPAIKWAELESTARLVTFDWRRILGTPGNKPKSAHEEKTCIWPAFKRMAVEVSHTKGSKQAAARELSIDSSRITEWRHSHKSLVHPQLRSRVRTSSWLNDYRKSW